MRTTIDLGIRQATPDDAAAVARTVAAAFFDDPTMVWIVPDPKRRAHLSVPMFRLYADAYIAHGHTYRTHDGDGVAVCLPPAAVLMTAEQEEAFGAELFELAPAETERLGIMEEAFVANHPPEPYWYLQFLATSPNRQGQGYGSALLRTMLELADAERAPAYHEATTHRNRALYERHGYVNLGVIEIPAGGPTLWRMWRDPR
jgi:GNAT superfamily N-acetyltransferase